MTDYNIAAILKREARRDRALAAGSTHLHLNNRTPAGVLPGAVSPLDRPELLWPSQRHLVPPRCWNCGASSANYDDGDLPYGPWKRGTITCRLCSQVIVRLKADGDREVIARPVMVTCDACQAQHWSDRACKPCERREAQRQANREMYARRRERARTHERLICAVCQERPAKVDRKHCSTCIRERAAEQLHRVLPRLMPPGVPIPASKLRALLGVHYTSITRIVARAQRDGIPITNVKHGWFRLEASHAS